MSRFNKSAIGVNGPKAVSNEGVAAFQKSAKHELCDRVLTCLWGQDKFYEKGSSDSARILELVGLVGKEDHLFLAKLAILAREKFNLRSVSQVLTGELVKYYKGQDVVAKTVQRIVQRPDDLLELMSYIIAQNATVEQVVGKDTVSRSKNRNKRIPIAVRIGATKVFAGFSEYHLSKYENARSEFKMRDLLKILRPKPANDEQAAMWKRLLEGKLKTAETWDRELTKAGQTANSEEENVSLTKDVWESQIMDRKIGYMAGLRNLRNILEAGVSAAAHKKLQEYLSNEKAVLNCKQFPFRFYSAYEEVSKLNCDPFEKKNYLKTLELALSHSGKNVSQLPGRTVLATDCSASMQQRISAKSERTCKEIAAILSALAPRYCEQSILCGFATNFKLFDLNDANDRVLENANHILRTELGGNTYGYLVFKQLLQQRIKVDRIIFFTDEEMNGGYSFRDSLAEYRKFSPETVVVTMNLCGYGTTQVDPNDPRNINISGWNDKALEFIATNQQYRNGIVDMVEAVEI